MNLDYGSSSRRTIFVLAKIFGLALLREPENFPIRKIGWGDRIIRRTASPFGPPKLKRRRSTSQREVVISPPLRVGLFSLPLVGRKPLYTVPVPGDHFILLTKIRLAL